MSTNAPRPRLALDIAPDGDPEIERWLSALGDSAVDAYPPLAVLAGWVTALTGQTAAAERWAAELGNPAYAIDDETAIKVVDGVIEVVSEGSWKPFTATSQATGWG